VGAQSVQTAQLLNAGQAQMQIPWGFWPNAAGLQPFGSNQIILRNQPDGTQGMFIQQQPATQTLQTQQNRKNKCYYRTAFGTNQIISPQKSSSAM